MNFRAPIDCRSISVRAGRRLLLENVSFQVRQGERIVIAGPSGAGKTTLLRAIAGLLSMDGGQILIDGNPASIAAGILTPPHQRGIGMVLQDLGLWPGLSVRKHFLMAPPPAGTSHAQHRAAVNGLIEQLGLTPHARRRPGTLSGGEQQRVALGAALMGNPRALLVDEPFQGLDLLLKDQLLEIVSKWAASHGSALLLVTHDPLEACRIGAQRLIIIEAGRIAADVTWESLANVATPGESATLTAWRERLRHVAVTSA